MNDLRSGSLFAGIGGADLAVKQAFGATPAWQLDLVGAAVRRRHWPSALQVEADVRTVEPADLFAVDVLVAGFPCQDLSCAGPRTGLDGARSGLYLEVLRFVGADPDVLYPTRDPVTGRLVLGVVRLAARVRQPRYVVLENVPGLLRYMPRLCDDLGTLGYGLTWTTCRALDAGHPHLRRRVFVVAELGAAGRGFVPLTPRGTDGSRPWATPRASDGRSPGASTGREGTDGLAVQARVCPWPTPATRDYRVGSGLNRVGTPPLSDAAAPVGGRGRRLNPDWIEQLMGYPAGWTDTSGPAPRYDPDAPAVRGRYPEDWDRTEVWPGHAWETPRTLPDGPPVKGRADRIRALGNAWCPQQGTLALHHLLAQSVR